MSPVENTDRAATPHAASAPSVPRVGRREVRARLGPIFSQVHDGATVEVINQGRRDIMLVAPAEFDQMRAARSDADNLRESITMLVAAASQGVRLPSETLERLGVGDSSDPDKLKWFRTHYPVRFTHDEDGNALRAALALTTAVFDEDEDEIEFVEEHV